MSTKSNRDWPKCSSTSRKPILTCGTMPRATDFGFLNSNFMLRKTKRKKLYVIGLNTFFISICGFLLMQSSYAHFLVGV